MRLDHIAISAAVLAEGVAWTEAALGVALAGGGVHPVMGTHNRLLGLGDCYLEVIAVDPAAAPPGRARWFGLDGFSGRPRLTNWICATDDLVAEIAASPAGVGVPLALARGDYRWRMAVPDTGVLPFDGIYPALIQWQGAAHPAKALPEAGCRLRRLEVAHPQGVALRAALAGFGDPRVVIVAGVAGLRAEIETPHGLRVLQ